MLLWPLVLRVLDQVLYSWYTAVPADSVFSVLRWSSSWSLSYFSATLWQSGCGLRTTLKVRALRLTLSHLAQCCSQEDCSSVGLSPALRSLGLFSPLSPRQLPWTPSRKHTADLTEQTDRSESEHLSVHTGFRCFISQKGSLTSSPVDVIFTYSAFTKG